MGVDVWAQDNTCTTVQQASADYMHFYYTDKQMSR